MGRVANSVVGKHGADGQIVLDEQLKFLALFFDTIPIPSLYFVEEHGMLGGARGRVLSLWQKAVD